MAVDVKSIISVIVILVVGLSLTPVVISTVASAAASLTGASQTLVNLIPMFYVIALLLATVYWAVEKVKAA